MDERPLAYSYIRFSSDRQQLGDSLRRQIALAEQYASEHGMSLDTHSYRDLGMSAYRGRNAIEGKLSTFLNAIDNGHIKPQVFLLIESLDRLSRSDVDEALELFLSIIRRGVSIVTLADNQLYNTASLKKDRGISLIISITVMMRSNEESAIKSVRGKEAWRAKAASGRILTPICPSWLEPDNDYWVIRKEKADIVRRIFDLASAGYGCLTICRKLNDAETATLGRSEHWTPSTVTRILKSPAVFGTLSRERAGGPPIENYYPPIVSREIFSRVRNIATQRAAIGSGQNMNKLTASNIFRGICYCAACNSRVFSIAGHREQYFLQCNRAYSRGGCPQEPIKGAWLEKTFLEELLSNPNEFNTPSTLPETRHFEQARHLCAALCGGRADAANRLTIRNRLQELIGRIVTRISLDTLNRAAVLQYVNGKAVRLTFGESKQTR